MWVEKEALSGVIAQACQKYRVPYFSCRGYVSQSEMWRAAMRYQERDNCVIIHLGDHDPSGIDMTRDIEDRMRVFDVSFNVTVERIALSMEQIEEFNPPPNPAKETDSRFLSYIENYGDKSWELDSLNPIYLTKIIQDKIVEHIDWDAWNESLELEEEEKESLVRVAETFLEGE